jgi:hypothetical protein
MKFVTLLLLLLVSYNVLISQTEEKRWITAESGLRMRSKPDLQSEKVSLIPYGTEISVLEKSAEKKTVKNITDYWYKTCWENKTGWIFGGFTTTKMINRQSVYDTMLIGTHLFSLQWISWEKFGNAEIGKTGDNYSIKGRQDGENGNYITINGTIVPVSKLHLVFEGEIEIQIDHINNGTPCKRTGLFNFKSTKNRKYWRLQEMDNPCDSVTDYVDIYFL